MHMLCPQLFEVPSAVQNKVWPSGVPRGGVGVFKLPPPEIPNDLQNLAKLNPICENC